MPVRPVVKADAYGHGAVPVARALEAAGADGFCVAAFDEALELREGGVRAPILVLYPVPAAFVAEAAAAGHRGRGRRSPPALAATIDAAARLDPARPLRVELEVETGLGRGGFAVSEVADAAREVAALARAQAGRPVDPFPGRQTIRRSPLPRSPPTTPRSRRSRTAGIALPVRHVAASAALLTDGMLAYDGVRPGLAVYGLVPDELGAAGPPASRDRPPGHVAHRAARPRRGPAGRLGISYGPTFRTARPSRIATLPVGYGDGWARAYSNRASALVRGRRVPLVGNVAMDAVMADVTDVPGPPVDAR